MIDLLYQAMTSPYGIAVATDNVHACQAACYRARIKADDPDLERLQFRPSPTNPEGELWIIKGPKKEDLPDATD